MTKVACQGQNARSWCKNSIKRVLIVSMSQRYQGNMQDTYGFCQTVQVFQYTLSQLEYTF